MCGTWADNEILSEFIESTNGSENEEESQKEEEIIVV